MSGKSVLRAKYKDLRKKLSPKEISEKSLDISDKLIQSFDLNNKYIHTYLPIFDQVEINTWLTVDRLMSIANVVASRADFETYTMEHVHLTNDVPVKTSPWGIPEPVGGDPILVNEIDVVLVPLLAFDKKGFRVGYGKGFYDRFLENVNEDCIKIGLSFFEVEENYIDDTTELDIPLDFCITPKNVYKF